MYTRDGCAMRALCLSDKKDTTSYSSMHTTVVRRRILATSSTRVLGMHTNMHL